MTDDSAPVPRRTWSGLLWLGLITLLGLPLISPLWRLTAVPCTHDGHLHYHRIAALRYAWDNGVLFSRWLPDVAFGYGYPFFIFREAPPLYLPFLPHLLGLPLPAASNLFYALTILAAGWFMFLWVRDIFNERAAVVSAVAYMAAPYILVDALIRGNSPESLALPLFPVVLWAGRRWVLGGSLGSFVAGVGGLALLALSHNISTLIFVPSLLVYLVVVVAVAAPDGNAPSRWAAVRGPFVRLVMLLVLGLGLTIFYTGGALAELDLVTLEQSTTTRNNDWRFNFASLAEIFAPVAPEDPLLVNPPLRLRLGWVPVALAALGTTGLWWIRGADRRAREQRAHIILMIAAAAVFLIMALPLSRWLWDSLPLIDFVQFPWRFVGRAALPVAFLAGVVFAHPAFAGGAVGWRRWAWLAVPAAVALLLLEAVPNLYPRYCAEDPFPTIVTVHDYERATGLVGVDPEGSYFPRTVVERPSGSPLEADYRAGQLPQRFDATVLPPGATLDDVVYDGLRATARVTSPEPYTARYLSFTYPGWSVTVDGRPVPITPEDPSGLITFPVPAGDHEIRVGWSMTPLRLALSSLSIIALVVSAGVVVSLWLQPQARRETTAAPPPERRLLAALALVGLLLLGFKLLVVDRTDTVFRRPGAPPVAEPAALVGGALRLDGTTLSRDTVPAGETFDIDIAWTATDPPPVDYQTNVWLEGPEGLIWSDLGTERPRLYEDAPPTRQWAAGEWGWDSREVRVLPGTPPGDYRLVVTLFDKATLQPVTLADATGTVGPAATLGTVTVTLGDAPITPQVPLEADMDTLGLRLLGYNQDRTAAAPGEGLLLTLFWQRLGDNPATEATVLLQDSDGRTVHEWPVAVTRPDFPPAEWGNRPVRGQYWLTLPADLPGGDYRLALRDGPALGQLRIDAPGRTTETPPLQQPIGETFSLPDGSPAATLVGLAQQSGVGPPCTVTLPAGSTCALILVWQAKATLPESYHVFLHLVDEAGNLIAQTDGVPAAWTRPTTGWLPGEVIADTHILPLPESLPDGPLWLRIGLYDPATGERLTTAAGDAVTLPAGD